MKKYIWIVGFLIILITLSGCGKSEPDRLKFASWGTETEMNILKPIIEKYNSENEIKVELVHVPQNYFQKLHLLFASNLAPDVILINNLYLSIYQKADLFEDLTNYIDKKTYFKNAISTLSVNGSVYAFPRDVSSMVIFYNKQMFDNAKIKIDENWTIDDFYDVAKRLKKNEKYGFCTEFDPIYIENFVSVENKPFFQQCKLTITENESLNSIQKISDKINAENIGVNKEQLALTPCLQLFLQQKTPMFVSGRWSVPKLDVQANFEYGILPFPKGKSKYYIPLNATGWAVSKKSKHKSEAIKFVKYLSDDENMAKYIKSGLIIPAKKDVTQQQNISKADVFFKIIDKSTPNIVPNDYNITIDKIKNRLDSVLGGYKSAKNAFSDL